MTKPQQPELRRSEKGATDRDSAKGFLEAEEVPAGKGNSGPVPPGNQPGWAARGERPAKRKDD